MRLPLPLPLLLCSFGVIGCEPVPDGCEPAEGEEPAVSLGKGETEYLPMDDGDGRIEIINGPQGGYHVEVGLEATYLDPSDRWEVQLEGTAGDATASSIPLVTMRCNNATGTLQSWGHLLIWDTEGPELDGRTADVHATTTDAAGTVVESDVTVEMFFPEAS